jgi:hypothetical protein
MGANMRNKSLVFSIALEGYERLFKGCIDTHLQYCKMHEYKYLLINRSPRKLKAAEAAWLKVPLIKAALEGGYEWVAFIDADCDIRTSMPPFTEYLDSRYHDKSIFMAPGSSGRINSGVIFIKGEVASLNLLNKVLKHANEKVPQQDQTAYENGHIIHFGKNDASVQLLEHNLWNNNSALNQDSFVQHYSGGPLRKWYMENRVPAPDKWLSLRNKVVRRIQKQINSRGSAKQKSISESIDELMPYYQNYYPDLFHASTINS